MILLKQINKKLHGTSILIKKKNWHSAFLYKSTIFAVSLILRVCFNGWRNRVDRRRRVVWAPLFGSNACFRTTKPKPKQANRRDNESPRAHWPRPALDHWRSQLHRLSPPPSPLSGSQPRSSLSRSPSSHPQGQPLPFFAHFVYFNSCSEHWILIISGI